MAQALVKAGGFTAPVLHTLDVSGNMPVNLRLLHEMFHERHNAEFAKRCTVIVGDADAVQIKLQRWKKDRAKLRLGR